MTQPEKKAGGLWGFIDRLEWSLLLIMALFLGSAPFKPEPHLFEKLRMLFQGTLSKPIDIFDLLFHSFPIILILLKLHRSINSPPGDNEP
ncbi:MAG: hypothetical protein HQL54_13190 [Magnetococcales bacterium]|nr:hypothetical protein [Magnetococcales bacterium]